MAARAAYMIPGGTLRPKDFTMVKKDGVYHLFFILHNTAVPADSTEREFGHAVSQDLYHWFPRPSVFFTNPAGWDNLHVWAPSILQYQGLYWMFYTGVSQEPGVFNATQRTGLAVSSDLVNWNRLDAPIFDTSTAAWAWWQPLNSNVACRDPFVMPTPQDPDQFYLYYTASLAADTAATVVGVASTDGELPNFQDFKPLLITWRNYTFNRLTESPHLFQHNGLWYLFITTDAGQPLSFYTSPDPVAPPSGWTYRGRLKNMLGFDTSTWFASETFRDGTRDLFLFVNGDRIEVREIQWSPSWQFSLLQPPLFHVVSMDWGSPVGWSGEQSTIVALSANPLAGMPSFETLVVDSLGQETVVPAESLGFYRTPAFFADTSYVPWIARRWPAVPDSDTVTVTRVRVRTTDQTAQTGILTVRAPRHLPVVPPDSLPPDPPDPTGDPHEFLPRARSLHALPGTPLGRGPALAVQLDRPAAVRVDLYDLAGRRVRALARRDLPAGASVLPWDGRDDAGARAPRGLYFARLEAPGFTLTTRLLYLAR